MFTDKIQLPQTGGVIAFRDDGSLSVPNQPIIPYIAGDGIGRDITRAMLKVIDAAVAKAYGGDRQIHWLKVYAGQEAHDHYGEWLPTDTLHAIRHYKVGIKGPLTTPVGEGFRSLNVSLRQQLELSVCLRPIEYFEGVPSPVKHPEKSDMVIFRENSEDIYAGIEFESGTDASKKLKAFLQDELGVERLAHYEDCGLGIKLISEAASKNIIRQAIRYAIQHRLPTVTLVHKGNIMKYTEGAFMRWGYELAQEEFHAVPVDPEQPYGWQKISREGHEIIINDVIADAFLQQILISPESFSVVATMNLNGDYISDALAAQVGGIGIAPGANLGDKCQLFEATHGTAPKYADKDVANPCSLILSAKMMLDSMHWSEAADLVHQAVSQAIADKKVTQDFARYLDGAEQLSCSAFADHMVTLIQHSSQD